MTALLVLAAGLLAAIAGVIAHVAVFAASVFDSPVVLDTVTWGLIAGAVTPLLTAVVQQPRFKWSSRTRALVGAGISIVVGLLTCLANGDLHVSEGQTILSTIAVVLVTSISTYKGLWKPTGVAGGIESATSAPPKNAA